MGKRLTPQKWLFVLFLWGGAILFGNASNAHAGLSISQAAVLSWATVSDNPPQIQLHWTPDSTAKLYEISRKDLAFDSWQAIATVPGTNDSWADIDVAAGASYEYMIRKDTGISQFGYGFISAGIGAPLVEDRGKIILLVEKSLSAPLGFWLARLEQDLAGDGWTVIRHDVAATNTPPAVKALIQEDYDADPERVKALFLFGHIAVPYSGDINPDGHPDHRGAWPADVYYGDMDGAWTDTSIVQTASASRQNWNVAGDGKFDQNRPPGKVRLQIGRVDLSNLTCFSNKTPSRSEIDLARQYLNKDHTFRHNRLEVPRRGFIHHRVEGAEDEPLGAGAVRAFGSFFGPDQIFTMPDLGFLDFTRTNAYLWGYIVTTGGFAYATDIGDTDNYAVNDPKVVFTSVIGSYFGDWDRESGVLRAALGASTYILTSIFSGQPQWILHRMALGETIGQAACLTQNNGPNGIYQPHRNFGVGEVHIALLGDPTLRMHPVSPPSDLTGSRDGSGLHLQWKAPADPAILGYNIYRSTNSAGPFTKIGGFTVGSTTTFLDPTETDNSIYMVRAVKLETTPAGTYYNASQGIFFPDPLNESQLTAPTRVSAQINTNAVTLSWVDPGGAEMFQIERRTTPDGQFTALGTAGGFETSFTDTAVDRGSYAYRVTALGANGAKASSPEIPVNLETPWAAWRGVDTTTAGDWIGAYGSEGYVVYDAITNFPAIIDVSLKSGNVRIFEMASTNPAALLRPDRRSRIKSARYLEPSRREEELDQWKVLEFQVQLHDAGPHRLALYHADAFAGQIDVFDAFAGTILASQPYSVSTNGQYLIFDIRNSVNVRLTPATNNSVSVAGIFIDPATLQAPGILPPTGNFGGQTVVTMTSTPNASIHFTLDGTAPDEGSPTFTAPLLLRSNAVIHARAFYPGYPPSPVSTVSLTNIMTSVAVFAGLDATNQGNWSGVYGQDGAWFGENSMARSFCDVDLHDAPLFVWNEATDALRALATGLDSPRLASSWSDPTELRVHLDIYSGEPHALALYFMDWDEQNRAAEVAIRDEYGRLLDQRSISSFVDGKYLVWNASGHLDITIRKLSGNNVILNGIFIGNAAPVAPALPEYHSAVQLDNGRLVLHISSAQNGSFNLQSSTDLQNWSAPESHTMIGTNLDISINIPFTAGWRFYRALPAP